MDKKEALKELIKNNSRISNKEKAELIATIDELSSEAIDAYGKILAMANQNDRKAKADEASFYEQILNNTSN